ncbi:CsbD family protein [Aliiglaciecola sp. CAU 1673]|uniref:CsbD family protein n=1 Tax=Aliiglaciecola sp. CAU 1673 TaxID=3032595 RepID=UPI0023DB0719|nr:CsbD family protein [Aliiglaciecola sp. CAU 1673]MDF2179323.1 CsbD family protein [Aliiglaciecola sp. CAU 1673]
MNLDIAQGKWRQLTGKVKQKWAELSNDEIADIEGKFENFYGTMQEKYGMTKEEAERAFEELSH